MRVLLRECSLEDNWVQRSAGVEEGAWSSLVASLVADGSRASEVSQRVERSSLRTFSELGCSYADGIPLYLDDRSNLCGTRLMTKCRLGCLQLMTRVAKQLRWPSCGGRCLLCGTGALESILHFVLVCPRLEVCRSRFWAELKAMLVVVGDVGEAFLVLYDSMSAERRLQLLLGGRCDATVDGIVRWMVDKAFKNFLVACWKLREELIGVVAVRDGSLFLSPPSSAGVVPQEVGVVSPVSWNVQRLEECKPYWLPWVESVESRALVSRSVGVSRVLLSSSC